MVQIGKQEVASALDEVAALLELKGENPFRVRAYQNAARLVETSSEELSEWIQRCENGLVKGIGKHLTEELKILGNGQPLPILLELRSCFPESLFELFRIHGLGPKKIKILYEQLNIESVDALLAACESGAVAQLKGFGKKTAQNILDGITRYRTYRTKFLFPEAFSLGSEILALLRQSKHCEQAELAGSLRRKNEIIGDIDIIVASEDPKQIMDIFVSAPNVRSVTAQGETKSSVVLSNGISADLRVVAMEHYYSTLQYFTGSKEHNIALRGIAHKKGLKLNEYGLYREERAIALTSEEDIYRELGLAAVAPEAREGLDELEHAAKAFARSEPLPSLITLSEIRGVLHCHSTYSDGIHTLKDLALATKQLGYEYLGISDHSRSAAYARGLSIEAVKKQHGEVKRLNEELSPFRIFHGIESDILVDGSLDYPDDILELFDFVIASVHSRFTLSREEMTSRVVRAVRNPFTTILGHPTGRLLLEREPYEIDLDAVIDAAAESGTAIEINANPHRLDLDWRYLRKAAILKISIPICPDAHSIDGLSDISYGIGIARKGMLTKENVLNTKSTQDLARYFKKENRLGIR